MTVLAFDVLIVGSGLAGLTAALHLAPTLRVAVVSKEKLMDGSSPLAQGGIAAVLAPEDSFEAHYQDTQIAGVHLCDPAATRQVIQEAPSCIAWLHQMGVPFTTLDAHDPPPTPSPLVSRINPFALNQRGRAWSSSHRSCR